MRRLKKLGCCRGCLLVLVLLYALQCFVGVTIIWHKYQTSRIGDIQLTLSYPFSSCVGMFVPGLGYIYTLGYVMGGGEEYEMVKALTIRLPDGRSYTHYSEDIQWLSELGMKETPQGIQITDAQGANWVDTAAIRYSAFQH